MPRPRRSADLDDAIEKGEIDNDCNVSGSETDDYDDEHRLAVLQPRGGDEGRREYGRRRLEDAVTVSSPIALPSNTPSAGSELTTSNGSVVVVAIAAAVATAPTEAREVFACRSCQKEFDTRKAADGHMRVHRQHATPKDDADNSWVSVVAEPRIDLDLSGVQGSSNAPPIPNSSAAPTVAPAANPPKQAIDHQPAAAAPSASAIHHAPLPIEGPKQGQAYRCKVQDSCKEFPTHQGLGGHAAGHLSRVKAAAAASVQGSSAGADGCHGGAGNGKHPCNLCGQEFDTGLALGGHKRKHYKGKLTINKKEMNDAGKLLSLAPPAPDLTLAAAEVTGLPPVDQPLLSLVGAEVAVPVLLDLADEAAALPQVDQADAEAAAEAAAPALLPSAAGAEAADDRAAPAAPLPVPTPIAGMRTVRIFGFLVEKPEPETAAEEGSASE